MRRFVDRGMQLVHHRMHGARGIAAARRLGMQTILDIDLATVTGGADFAPSPSDGAAKRGGQIGAAIGGVAGGIAGGLVLTASGVLPGVAIGFAGGANLGGAIGSLAGRAGYALTH